MSRYFTYVRFCTLIGLGLTFGYINETNYQNLTPMSTPLLQDALNKHYYLGWAFSFVLIGLAFIITLAKDVVDGLATKVDKVT